MNAILIWLTGNFNGFINNSFVSFNGKWPIVYVASRNYQIQRPIHFLNSQLYIGDQ
jgi:hypothetical protein